MVINYASIVEFLLLVAFATVHGYVGAWLAVRMLFRPRNPVKFLGITVFPQGMIPRHRDRLAAAIGKAVGEELVSQETIVEELFGKEFLRKKIESIVNSYATDLLAQDYPSLAEALPETVRAPVLDAISSLQSKIAEHIAAVLKSEETADAIGGFVNRRVDEMLSRRVSETVDDETFTKIVGFLETRIRTIAREPDFETKIRDFISRRVDDLATAQTPLGDLFTDDAVALLKDKANEQIEPIVRQLAEIVGAERTRTQIAALIKREVHDFYENLSFFKKIFVSRENLLREVDDLVNESLPKRVEETLRGAFFVEEAKNFLDRTINKTLARPIPEIVGTIAPEQLERLKTQIAARVFSFVQSDEMMKSVSAYMSDALERIRPHSIGAILQTAHPQAEAKLKKMLSKSLLNVFNRDETLLVVNNVLSNQIKRLLAAPIGKLSDHVSEEKVRQAGKSLTDTIINAARERLPEAIREFDIGTVVREKINEYPVEKLESLVLSIAKEHLRTIELFGAFFGFALGVGQFFFQHYVSEWLVKFIGT